MAIRLRRQLLALCSSLGAALHREPNGDKLRLEASLTPRQRELPVSLFLSGLPTWAAAILLVIAPTIAAMYGPVLMRRRVGLERLTNNNEIAGMRLRDSSSPRSA
jgi:hypothetical protein